MAKHSPLPDRVYQNSGLDYVLGPYNQTKFGGDPSKDFFSPYTRNIHHNVHMFTTFFVVFVGSLNLLPLTRK